MEPEVYRDIDFSVLKPEVGHFRLQVVNEETEEGYAFCYYTDEKNLRWDVVYDKEVEDFTVKIRYPLFTINDIRFIKESFEEFWPQFLANYEKGLYTSLISPKERFTTEYKSKKLAEWDYREVLPAEIGRLRLDITPDRAILGINGSYIVATYLLPEGRSGIILYYNVYRDEFFCEMMKEGVPVVTHELDAKELKEWEGILQEKLANLSEKLIS